MKNLCNAFIISLLLLVAGALQLCADVLTEQQVESYLENKVNKQNIDYFFDAFELLNLFAKGADGIWRAESSKLDAYMPLLSPHRWVDPRSYRMHCCFCNNASLSARIIFNRDLVRNIEHLHPNTSSELVICSHAAGGLLQEYALLAALLDKGYTNLKLIVIDPIYVVRNNIFRFFKNIFLK